MDREELLSISLRGLHLLKKADKATVVSDLCGLQAQFATRMSSTSSFSLLCGPPWV